MSSEIRQPETPRPWGNLSHYSVFELAELIRGMMKRFPESKPQLDAIEAELKKRAKGEAQL